ncbi:hypothetical protein [Salininema proteolyticum]|uniref:DUF3592 domain-containing protein n=1 Tax=Salininema proteolyticum TaxID=1607685 RepID=A0ABV8TYL6_9ACTN
MPRTRYKRWPLILAIAIGGPFILFGLFMALYMTFATKEVLVYEGEVVGAYEVCENEGTPEAVSCRHVATEEERPVERDFRPSIGLVVFGSLPIGYVLLMRWRHRPRAVSAEEAARLQPGHVPQQSAWKDAKSKVVVPRPRIIGHVVRVGFFTFLAFGGVAMAMASTPGERESYVWGGKVVKGNDRCVDLYGGTGTNMCRDVAEKQTVQYDLEPVPFVLGVLLAAGALCMLAWSVHRMRKAYGRREGTADSGDPSHPFYDAAPVPVVNGAYGSGAAAPDAESGLETDTVRAVTEENDTSTAGKSAP